MSVPLHTHELTRYLTLLGIPRRDPGREALRELVSAHLTRIPFENISKLYRWKMAGRQGIVECAEFLDGIEDNHFGGTCYTINDNLYRLLVTLGYDATLCGADMSRPDVHLVILVRLEGREYIVDAGYAAPFLEPLPRDLPVPHELSLGAERYVLHPQDARGRSRLSLYRGGSPDLGYLVNPAPRRIEEFAGVIADSFGPDATFINAVLLVVFAPGRSTRLHNLTLTECEGNTVRKTVIATRDDLVGAIHRLFSIPPSISRVALEGVDLRRDAWS